MGQVAWRWAFLSGLVHIPYFLLLALCYRYGDFSLVYPLARGGGALVAALGGAILLADHLPRGGLGGHRHRGRRAGLARRAGPRPGGADRARPGRGHRDLHAGRRPRRPDLPRASYGFASLAADAITAAVVLTFSRRWTIAGQVARSTPALCFGAGLAAVAAYALVLAAVRHAPVGYVTALRESSVVIAAFAGWRFLHEPPGKQRLISSSVVLLGLVLLIAAG